MEFLHLRNYVHGSLCSFNVFVTGHLNLKINCFSLAFEDKYALNAIPRWIAPEVFLTKTLSKQADVWSFGVTMWELFNCGAIPYNHLTVDEVIQQTRTGQYKLAPRPGDAVVARLFDECFNLYPQYRPSFSQIRLVLERLLEGSEVALTNKFACCRRLQYANTTLLDKIFYDQQEVDVAREENVQRPLYFPLPPQPQTTTTQPPPTTDTGTGATRSGSISRIPITIATTGESWQPGAQRGRVGSPVDVTYADPLEDYQPGGGRNTGATMDLLSTSSAEFEDISTSSEDRPYNNLENGLLPPKNKSNNPKMRRVSSLNDLMNFRDQLQLRPPLDRPKSVFLNEDRFTEETGSCSSDEYEDADQMYHKKNTHSSLRRFGSALHASFRRIRQKGVTKTESGYETLQGKNDNLEKRSLKNLFNSSKRWMGTKSPVPNKKQAVFSKRGSEEVSQSETCLITPTSYTVPVLPCTPPPLVSPTLPSTPPPHHPLTNGVSESSPNIAVARAISVSSGFSIPISVYSDYEIPDEILEASLQQQQQSPVALPSSQSNLSVDTVPLPKSRSAHEIWSQGSDHVVFRHRTNSQSQHDRTLKHSSCLIDYSPTSTRTSNTKLKRKGVLSRSFNRSFNRKKQGKSISDILGTPPAVPTDRRPSILCTCCNSVHVCQTLPGMSLTRSNPTPPRIYENTRDLVTETDDTDYETLPVNQEPKEKQRYETLAVENQSSKPKRNYETVDDSKIKSIRDYETISLKTDSKSIKDYETLSNCKQSDDFDTDYEDVDNEEASLTQVTSTFTQVSRPSDFVSPTISTSPSSMTSSDYVTTSIRVTSSDSVFEPLVTSDFVSSEHVTCSSTTPALISPGEIAITLEL